MLDLLVILNDVTKKFFVQDHADDPLVTEAGTQSLTNKAIVNPTEVLTAARTLTMADSGKDFFLATAGGFAVTLPAVATSAGFNARFFVRVAPTTAYTIATNGAEQKLAGLVFSGAGADEDSETDFTATTVSFVANTAVINDSCEIWCDGAGWYARCFCNATGGITITG